jgi:parvulin-like peptidyl-prolyl isomerase
MRMNKASPGRWPALLLAALLVLAAGCGPEGEEEGVVARVNGRPIHLEQLEARYDLLHMGWSSGMTPTVPSLKEEYGGILSDLIVQELVEQELEQRGLRVTDGELESAEQEVRADYPEGAFEEVLVEEYVDLEVWRRQLRARLARKKFLQEVLRPTIALDYQEAESYYREHISDFYLPPRIAFVLINGPSRETVEKAAALYLEKQDKDAVTGNFNLVTVQELKMREDRLPADWSSALARLEEGQASAVIADQSSFESLVLEERIPAKVLDPSRAYPLVEKVLLERKLHDAFSNWLEREMANAEILVTTHLLPDKPDPAAGSQDQPLPDALPDSVGDMDDPVAPPPAEDETGRDLSRAQ